MKYKKQRFTIWESCLVIIILLGLIYVRASWFEKHFTHYDDIKVAQLSNYNLDVFAIDCASKWGVEVWDSLLYQKSHEFFAKPYNLLRHGLGFSKYWTYAPAQFVVTFGLLPLASNYESIKFYGRLPSLIWGIMALLACYYVCKKYTKSNKSSLLATCILGLSWQAILYCMHMSNYEVIILAGFLTALLLYNAVMADDNKKWYISSLLIGVMTWFHYQVVCYFAGFMLVYLTKKIIDKVAIKRLIIGCCINCICYAIVVIPLVGFANLNSNPTWNIGKDGEYLFKFSFNIVYIVSFYIKNFWVTFKAMLSPAPLETWQSDFITVIYLLLFCFGIINGIRKIKTKIPMVYLCLFCIGVIICQLFFVFLGSFTLSPTRHSNILIPVFVLGILNGLNFFLELAINTSFKKICTISFLLVLVGIFGKYYPSVKENRIDYFDSSFVDGLITKYQPDLIVDRSAPQLWYLVNQDYTRRQIIDYQTDFFDLDDKPDNNHQILIVSHTAPVDSNIMEEICDYLVLNNFLTNEYGEILLDLEPIEVYEQTGEFIFDFCNVTDNAEDNLYYYIYNINK